MKVFKIYQSELSYQLRQYSTAISALAVVVLTFMFAASVIDNAKAGEVLINSPIIISSIAAFSCVFSLLLIVPLSCDALLRDTNARMDSIVFTTPVSKYEYIYARWFATCTIAMLLQFIAITVVMITIQHLPQISPELFGIHNLNAYWQSFLIFTIPNILVTTSLLYVAVLVTRHASAAYIIAMVLFFLSVFSMDALAGPQGKWILAQLLDWSGFSSLKILRHQWAPINLHTQLVTLDGVLTVNRCIWLGASIVMMQIVVIRFHLMHSTTDRKSEALHLKVSEEQHTLPRTFPKVKASDSLSDHLYQVFHLSLKDFKSMITRWSLAAMFIIIALMGYIVTELLEGPLGVPLIATTNMSIKVMDQKVVLMIFSILITLVAGELVWRERDGRISMLVDATPVREWVQALSKLFAVILIIIVIQFILVLTMMAVQVASKNFDFNLSLYVKFFFGIQLVDYLLVAIMALFVQVLVNQKYAAYLIAFIILAYMYLPEEFGIYHNLLVYGADSGIRHTEMTGFDPYIVGWLSFKSFWILVACLLSVGGLLFWVRGIEHGTIKRFQIAKSRLLRPMLVFSFSAVALVVCSGSYIYYNTNVLNSYLAPEDLNERRVEYERRFSRFDAAPQPRVTSVSLNVELYPAESKAEIVGKYTLINDTREMLDSLHVLTASGVSTNEIVLAKPYQLVLADEIFGYHIFKLTHPLLPGDSVDLSFKISRKRKGFEENGIDASITSNASFVMNEDWLPAIGYQSDRELKSAATRKHHGLPARSNVTPLNDANAKNKSRRDPIMFNATIGTTKDQLAVTAGELTNAWSKNERNYYEFNSKSPLLDGFAFLSGKYKVLQKDWRDVAIKIYHHPDHTLNLDRMMQSVHAALEYHSNNFGPYPYSELKLVEYPGGGSLTSFPTLITYPEEFAILNPDKDRREFDLPFAVVAHEVAHQWWGNQLSPAYVEGAPLLTESLAWYTAMAIYKDKYGQESLQRLLDVMHESYLTPRTRANVPLIRNFDKFLAYRKGPFAMYALQEYIGADKINAALKSLLLKFRGGRPPLPTSLDLYHELETVTPDSCKQLLYELFKENTFWDLRMKKATASQQADSSWVVRLNIEALKHAVDTVGNERLMRMNDYIEIGIFAAGEAENAESTLYLKKHKIQDAPETLEIVVPTKPSFAGIDPRNILIDTNVSDNIQSITLK